MQIFSRRSVQVGVLIFVTIALALSAQAAGFSKVSLKGSYSFLGNRWTADMNANQQARVGVETFDGAGNATESYTQISDGVVTTGTISGTYTVNPDGTGTINWASGNQLTITLNSTAAKLAHGFQFLLTTDSANEVTTGTALLQSTTAQTYSVASVKGNFTFLSNMWMADGNVNQDGSIGIFSYDGKGKVTGSVTGMNGGVPYTGTFTGTYTVNPDGTGSLSLTSGTENSQAAFALNSVVAGKAKGSQFLLTTTQGNVVKGGIALKQ